MSEKCKYELPCGWCDKFDKRCEFKLHIKPISTITPISLPTKKDDTKIGVLTSVMRCGACIKAEHGLTFDSLFRCTLTGEFHHADDMCNCNYLND